MDHAGSYIITYLLSLTHSAARLDVSVPSIVLVKRNDPLQSKVVFQGEYTEEAIVQFVKYSSLPKYVRLQKLYIYTLHFTYYYKVIP